MEQVIWSFAPSGSKWQLPEAGPQPSVPFLCNQTPRTGALVVPAALCGRLGRLGVELGGRVGWGPGGVGWGHAHTSYRPADFKLDVVPQEWSDRCRLPVGARTPACTH